jgi:hypothetical protein
MSQVAVDVLVEIHFDAKDEDPKKSCIYTNARTYNGALQEIIEAWIQDQIGRGADPAKAVERDIYKIKLGLVLEDDSFCTEADTGNKGLTCGIVMAVLRDLKEIPVKTLAERPQA